MSRIVTQIVLTSCPQCGQEAVKVTRRLHHGDPATLTKRVQEPCMACLLQPETPAAKLFLIRQWRLLWHSAGGKLEDIPDAIRYKDDPPRPVKAPLALPALTINKAHAQIPRGANTPNWKNETKLLEGPSKPAARPRVLFVSHDLEPAGAERILLNLLPQLRGMDIALYSYADGPLASLFRDRGIPVTLKWKPERYDLVAVNTLASFSAVEMANKAGVPVVWFNHEWSTDPFLSPEHYGELASCVRRNIFAHAAQRSQYPQIPDTRTEILPTVIPPAILPTRADSRRKLSIATDSFVVISFGRDESRKGQPDLRQASEGTDLEVRFVAGEIDTRAYLAAADCYVSTSRAECYPLSIQEAKAARLPVIATDLPVHQDMIRPGINGYLYTPGDTEMLRELLLRLHLDGHLRRQLGDAPIFAPRWDDYLGRCERLLLAEAGGGVSSQEEIRVVYHICGMGDFWREVVVEQLGQLKRHGLGRIHVTHCGEGLAWCYQQARDLGMDMVVCSHDDALTVYERPAIQLIERMAAASDVPILYLHSKGVSHTLSEGWYAEWRRLMMDELVPHWRSHVLALDTYDALGVNWWTAHNKWHFSGNFWMAHPRWLRKLPSIDKYWIDRYSPERWIGAIPGCNAKSLLCQDAAFWDKDRQLLAELRNAQQERRLSAFLPR